MIWINSLVVICQMYIIFLQGRNFFLFHLKNGANRERWLMFFCGTALFIHSILHFSFRPMYFLLACSLGGIQLYGGYKYLWTGFVKLFKKHTFNGK